MNEEQAFKKLQEGLGIIDELIASGWYSEEEILREIEGYIFEE